MVVKLFTLLAVCFYNFQQQQQPIGIIHRPSASLFFRAEGILRSLSELWIHRPVLSFTPTDLIITIQIIRKNYFTFGCFADVWSSIPRSSCLPCPIRRRNQHMTTIIRLTFTPVSVVHDWLVQPYPLAWKQTYILFCFS